MSITPDSEAGKASILAVLILKDKSPQDMAEMRDELAEEEARAEFAAGLRVELSRDSYIRTPEQLTDLCNMVVSRVIDNINLRLATADAL